jgi:hypothetical protein
MRMGFLLLLSVAIGCGDVSVSPADAQVDSLADAQVPPADALVDAPPVCDPTKPFGTPVLVRGLENTAGSVPRLSLDERTLYFTNSGASQSDLYVARLSSSGAFGPPQPLMSPPNSPVSEFDPTVSPDGMTLWFSSDRANGPLPQSLYVATRTASSDFDNANPASLNSQDTTLGPYVMGQPYLPATGSDVWFISSRSDGKGMSDIWRATRNGSEVGVQHPATELNSTDADFFPTVSADGLTIYFASTRPAPGGTGAKDFDIWTSHRAHVSDDFPAPTPVNELNTTMIEFPGWLSIDNCRLYMSSDRSQGGRLYVATREP